MQSTTLPKQVELCHGVIVLKGEMPNLFATTDTCSLYAHSIEEKTSFKHLCRFVTVFEVKSATSRSES